MPEVSIRAIMIAIKALNLEIERTADRCDRADDDMQANLEELLLSYEVTASELENIYNANRRFYEDLPPYSELIGRSN